jgi:hypothetical protein
MNLLNVTLTLFLFFVSLFAARLEAQDIKKVPRVGVMVTAERGLNILRQACGSEAIARGKMSKWFTGMSRGTRTECLL